MAQIQPPETFDFSTPNEWPKWRKRFERYLVVSGMKKKEEADKIDLFMYLMGDRADDIFRTFKFEKEEEATKIDSVLKAFDSHFCVRKNIIYEHKQAKTAEVKAVSELDEEIGFLLEVSAVEDSSNLDNDEDECRRRWTAEIQVNGKKVKFKLDSQADVTCVPLCLFKKIMGQQRLVESDINIRAAEFSELQTVGMFISTLRNGNYEIKEKIYVIRRLSEPLLSRRACELLNLARRIEVVATRINPIKEFPEVFEGLGQIGNPYEIKLKPGAKPYAVHTPRRVPIPLMEKLRTRLEELEKAGIIAQVNVATEWCAPTVIAGKPNGDIRLCVDLSRLNEHVQREVHPMPVVEHMLGKLGEARFFSKLDANSGFHQIPLSPDCQHLTTFITPFGRYKYCRMPFGISLAPEYFQKVMSIILQGMDGVMCYLDDILIFASDSKTHDRILRLVLRKLKEAKVTLNKAKCVFGVPRINFLGHILDEDGIRPDPAKIEAVAKMPAPTDVHGVRRFLGMVNHLGRKLRTTLPIAPENLNPKLVDSQTLKRKEGRRRKDMKSRYDRRCGATDMEELSEDAYTKWLEIVIIKDITSRTIIGHLREIFARFGLPELLHKRTLQNQNRALLLRLSLSLCAVQDRSDPEDRQNQNRALRLSLSLCAVQDRSDPEDRQTGCTTIKRGDVLYATSFYKSYMERFPHQQENNQRPSLLTEQSSHNSPAGEASMNLGSGYLLVKLVLSRHLAIGDDGVLDALAQSDLDEIVVLQASPEDPSLEIRGSADDVEGLPDEGPVSVAQGAIGGSAGRKGRTGRCWTVRVRQRMEGQ
ncbi:K02A2.6-like [Cordylochernes scorpioides]|uniref:K02A2.6-like n=1 Tax=Cordylochernes scorpioides TaxID=51811 RepID=A0ABY6K5J4_9ARAC|nr:K02A2.6-like [Cordylochernes scorpioides]